MEKEHLITAPKAALETVTNVKIGDSKWAQASLLVSFGGLGSRRVAGLALPAYLTSVHATADLVSTTTNHTTDFGVALEPWSNISHSDAPTEDKRKV